MNLKRGATGVAALLCISALVSGCAASHGAPDEAAAGGVLSGAQAQPRARASLDGSAAVDYSSVAQLKQDSTAVIVGIPSGSRLAGPADEAGQSRQVSAFVTSVVVEASTKGSVPRGTTIDIRQLAATELKKPSNYTLQPGKAYLLFLQPFTFGDGTPPTGQYVITGDQGAYELGKATLADPSSSAKLVPGIQSRLPIATTVGTLAGG